MNVKHAKFYDSLYFISQYVAVLLIKLQINQDLLIELYKKQRV